MINAVMEAIRGLRIALGPHIIMQYLLQGLFHPARKVRTIYWKIYNMLYIGQQDALVPIWPLFELDEGSVNHYRRDEMLYFL